MCYCGDTYCPSCGPAQGNAKCYVCGKWSADGGCDDSEKCNAEARKQEDEFAAQLEEERRQGWI
jgi:hypothetical protein